MQTKRFSLALTCLLTACVLIGCANNGNTPTIIEDEHEYGWVYEQENADEYDPYMLVDGKLDEPVWQNQEWLHHQDKGISLAFSSYFTKRGFYLAGVAEDPGIKWFSRLYFQNNSSFWFNIKTVDQVYTHATEVMNIFVDPYNAVSRNLNRFVAKAITNKPINEGASRMTVECFMSWDELHVDIPAGQDYPDVIRVNPHYRYVEGAKSASNDWVRPLFFFDDNGRHNTSGRFGPKGYINADMPGAILGDAKNGISKSDGWDISKIDLGAVKSDGPHSQAIFFKDIFSTQYVFETKMEIIGGIQDTYPSAGICNAQDEIVFDTFHITGNDVLNNSSAWAAHHLSFDNNGRAGWVDKTLFSVPNSGSRIISLKCIRDGSTFHYIVNGNYLGSESITHFGENGSCPGFYTLGCEALFFDYSAKDFTNDDEGLEQEIMKHAYPVKVEVTGDGTAFSSPSAVVSGKGVTISVSPISGNIVSNFYVTDVGGQIVTRGGENVDLDYYLANVIDGQIFVANVTEKLIVHVQFEKFDSSTSRILTSIFDEITGLPISNTKFSFRGNDKRLYFSGMTGSAGGVVMVLPKAGTYTISGKQLVVNGIYDLYIEQSNFPILVGQVVVPADAAPRIEIDPFYAPNLLMNQNIDKSFEDGGYVYYSKPNSFKYSGYEYSGTYANTAVYSVEIESASEISSWGYPGWSYNVGIIMTQSDLIDGSITGILEPFNNNTVRKYANPGNEYFGVHVGISHTGIQTNVGPLDYVTKKFATESAIGGSDPHTRVFTAVLKENVIYYYLDNEFMYMENIDSQNYAYSFKDQSNNFHEYKFSKDKPVMFGVNFTNNQNSGIKARVVEEHYGNDALNYLDNFSTIFAEVA